jgi:hypothetical protein
LIFVLAKIAVTVDVRSWPKQTFRSPIPMSAIGT